MATRTKESSPTTSPVGKEKKDSHTSTTHTKPTKTSTSSTDHKQTVKSYLKPTLSSKTESFKNKKIGSSPSTVDHHHNDDSNQNKATLNRRRSFDKPPSAASRFQKSLLSPGPRDRNVHLKSSSFSSKSSTKPTNIGHENQKLSNSTHTKLQYRPVSNKPLTKSSTASGSVNVKKNTTQNKNKEAVSAYASSTKIPKSGNYDISQTSTDHIEVEQEADQSLGDHHDQIAEIEQSHEDDDHNQEVKEVLLEYQKKSPEISNNEHVEENSTEDKSGEQSDHKSTVSEEIKADISDEASESIQVNEGESNVTSDINSEEGSVDQSETKDEVVKKEIVKEGDDHVEEAKEEENEKNDVKGVEEEDEVVSGNDEEGCISSKKEEEEAKVEVKRQSEQGNKKESPAAYNDVIEETASKLLEKRKNKVRALVGAFETVIDYESK